MFLLRGVPGGTYSYLSFGSNGHSRFWNPCYLIIRRTVDKKLFKIFGVEGLDFVQLARFKIFQIYILLCLPREDLCSVCLIEQRLLFDRAEARGCVVNKRGLN
jgi:hypothetical protein